jgi:unsaturated pyranuronate lyase
VDVYRAVSDLPPARVWDGVLARAIHTERLTIGFLDIEPNVQVPEHRHANEQVGFALRGTITMVVDGKTRVIKAGHTYTIPSNVSHSATAGPEGVSVVDVFAPPREDWKKAPMEKPSPGRWP